MNFTTAQKVLDTIQASDEVERIRANNRIKVNDLFNGVPPLSTEEAKRWNMRINVNFGEGPVLAAQARRQYNNAFIKPGNFFKVSIPLAPDEHQTEWGMTITDFINRAMKKSKPYFHLKQNQFASVISHGIGSQLWCDKESWAPEFVAIEDLRVPTETKVSLENLEWFAVRYLYTEGELCDKVFGENSAPGWQKKPVAKLLNEYHDKNHEQTEYDWMNAPEKMAELVKQNLGYYSSDAVPTIPLWHFYFQDRNDRRETVWRQRVVPDWGVRGVNMTEFLYTTQRPAARDLSELLHVQFGDLNNKPPFMYHSVRSLGFLLMEPCFWTNLSRCRLLQHMFESFNVWLRTVDPAGRARAQKFEMFDKAIVPEGVSIVPNTERHQIDADLVESVMAQLKQLMSEASSSYTQQTDSGTRKEQTAFETQVKLSMVNAMMSGMLNVAFFQETFAYREICRRFCLRNTSDPDAKKFQKLCAERGIPKVWVNAELWDIEPDIPLGAGNPTMAITEASQLMANREKYDPTAQQEILHDFTTVVTGNPRKAARLVPLDKDRGVTDAQRDSEFAFGTLMQGVPVRMKQGLSPIEQIETLLGLMAGVIARIEQQTNLASPNEMAGLSTVSQYIGGLIRQLARNPAEKPRVKNYSDALGKLMNALKGFAQRAAQRNGKANGRMDPEAQAKMRTQLLLAQSNAKIKERKSKQQQFHKEISFTAEERRKDAQAIADIGREHMKMGAEHKRKQYAAFNGGEE